MRDLLVKFSEKMLTAIRQSSRMPGFVEGFPSGQRDQTVNLTAPPSEVRILPPPPLNLCSGFGERSVAWLRGCSSMVELQPSKLNTWVRFPSPAPFLSWSFQDVRELLAAHVAQLVEHTLGKGEVSSSNLLMGSINPVRFMVNGLIVLKLKSEPFGD